VIYNNDIMKTLSLKLDDSVFQETEQVIGYVKKSRNRYINEALDFYNKLQKREMLSAQLKRESKLVAEGSLEVLKEFDQAEDEGQAI
jgi:hypothetical protein